MDNFKCIRQLDMWSFHDSDLNLITNGELMMMMAIAGASQEFGDGEVTEWMLWTTLPAKSVFLYFHSFLL